jgi:hypothetical protein
MGGLRKVGCGFQAYCFGKRSGASATRAHPKFCKPHTDVESQAHRLSSRPQKAGREVFGVSRAVGLPRAKGNGTAVP